MFNYFYPVLFDDDILHCDVTVKGMKPTSAGHYSTNKGVYGQSETLDLNPKTGDNQIINVLISYLSGIKEKGEVKPKRVKKDFYVCGNCGDPLDDEIDSYCSVCGYKVKWKI